MNVFMSSACSPVSPPPCTALLQQQVRSPRCPGHGSALLQGWIWPQRLLRSFHPFSSPSFTVQDGEKKNIQVQQKSQPPSSPFATQFGLQKLLRSSPWGVGLTDDRYWHG